MFPQRGTAMAGSSKKPPLKRSGGLADAERGGPLHAGELLEHFNFQTVYSDEMLWRCEA
jgi:hypothetical protein